MSQYYCRACKKTIYGSREPDTTNRCRDCVNRGRYEEIVWFAPEPISEMLTPFYMEETLRGAEAIMRGVMDEANEEIMSGRRVI